MERLVYTPRIDVFVKTQSGEVVDLSPYVVSCSVNRKLNQVSTASVSFRNPNRIFTNFPYTDVSGNQRFDSRFKPQDPIIIVMTRLRNYPIQVFTGYCDTVPYLSFYPGVVQLEASCTLKRLLYTYFDPGLPFFMEFLQKNGWAPYGANTSMAFNPGAISKTGDKPSDAGFGTLLENILVEIGNWDKKNIFIEDLPENIVEQVSKLYDDIEEVSKEASEEFLQFLKSIIGTSTFGDAASGGGDATGDVTAVPGVPDKFLPMYQGAASQFGLGDNGWAYLAAIHEVETAFSTNTNDSSAGAQGPMQFMPATWAGYGVDADGDGVKNIQSNKDAIYGAAKYLKASGAPGDWYKAIYAYNHADWYVQKVKARAKEFIAKAQRSSTSGDGAVTGQLGDSPIAWSLTGTASTFGSSHKYNYTDPGDDSYGSQKPASGLDPDVPGIATRNSSRTGGWWVIRAPNGKAAALRQTDYGPNADTGCAFDINTPAAHVFGYEHGDKFPTKRGTWKGYYCGKNDSGRKKAERLVRGS